MNALAPGRFRLIRGHHHRREPAVGFLALADAIQRRDGCPRLEALQRACDEHPAAFENYVAAMN
jgi:hypothetical protein